MAGTAAAATSAAFGGFAAAGAGAGIGATLLSAMSHPAVSAGGTLLSAAGRYQDAQAQQQLYRYQAQVAEMQAQDAAIRGDFEAKQHRLRVSQLVRTQRAAFASSGALVGYGSPMETLADTEFLARADEATIRYNAAREAWSARASAGNLSASARAVSPLREAGGTLLGGLAEAGSKYRRWKDY